MTDKSIADELQEVLEAHRQKQQALVQPPADQVQWEPDDEGIQESSE
jgi:hypothetical protein